MAKTVFPTFLSPLQCDVPGRRRRSFWRSPRIALWGAGLALAAAIYFGLPAYWNWPHPIGASGGRFFTHRVALTIPVFQQGDPRWNFELLGPSIETLGQSGCAVTCAAMVLKAYGVDTDPQRLNQYLTLHNGYTPQGWIYWEKAAELGGGQIEKAYEGLPSYALIDRNLLAGNPVIVRLTLANRHTHFVVIVGKQGWDYLIQDPAHGAAWGVYPLKTLTSNIVALRFYRLVPPPQPAPVLAANVPSS